MEKYIKLLPYISLIYLFFAIPQFIFYNKLHKSKQEKWTFLKNKYIENSLYALIFIVIYLMYFAIRTLQNPSNFPISFSLIFAFLAIQLSFAMYRLKQYYFIYPIVEITFVFVVIFIYFYSSVGTIKTIYLDRIKIVFAIIGVLFVAVRGFETIEKRITPDMDNRKAVQYWKFLTSKDVDDAYKIKDIIAIVSVILAFIGYIFFYKIGK